MGRAGYVSVRGLAVLAVALAVLAAAVAGISLYRGRAVQARRGGIVSLSPALTDLLFQIGAGEQVVGVSDYSQLPPGQDRPVVGNAMQISREQVLKLQPRAIVTQQRPGELLVDLQARHGIEVSYIRIETLDDLRRALGRLDRIAGTHGSGRVIARIDAQLDAVRRKVAGP